MWSAQKSRRVPDGTPMCCNALRLIEAIGPRKHFVECVPCGTCTKPYDTPQEALDAHKAGVIRTVPKMVESKPTSNSKRAA